MIGDLYYITKKERKRAKKLCKRVLKLQGRNIITIGGISGVRKSELKECLLEELYKNKKRALGISLDDWYIAHFCDRERLRKRDGIQSVGLKEIDWKALKKVIKDFKKKKETLRIQEINKYTGSFEDRIIYETDKLEFLIIEGLYASYLKKFKMSSLAIHLEGSLKQTLAFRRKRMKENEDSLFRVKIVQREANIVAQLKKYADIIVSFKDGE